MHDMMLYFRQIWDPSTNDIFIDELPGGSVDSVTIGGCCLPGKDEWKHHIYIICSDTIRLVGVNLPDSKVIVINFIKILLGPVACRAKVIIK